MKAMALAAFLCISMSVVAQESESADKAAGTTEETRTPKKSEQASEKPKKEGSGLVIKKIKEFDDDCKWAGKKGEAEKKEDCTW